MLKVPVVIDNGTGFCKAGFANKDRARSIFPTVVGRAEKFGVLNGMGKKESYVGFEAQMKREILSLKCPINRGVVTHWDDMYQIWYHAFYYSLRIDPKEHPVMVTEIPTNPLRKREKMTEMMFEKFQLMQFYSASQPMLALFSTGRTTGVVIDSGTGVSHSVPIYEGFSLPYAIHRLDLGGQDVTEYLRRLLAERGFNFNTPAGRDIIREIKETMCYMAPDFEQESVAAARSNSMEKIYTLPDGREINLINERFCAPEVMYQPQFLGHTMSGLHEITHNSIVRCHLEVRMELYKNILLSGGNTLISGIAERFGREMTALAPSTVRIKLFTPPERKESVWLGGSILASLPDFRLMWITKEQYEEIGPNIIERKCF